LNSLKTAVKSTIRNPKFEIHSMSEPEISRRCPECGASIRVRAFFCPQCGRAFASEAKATAELESSEQSLPAKHARGETGAPTETQKQTENVSYAQRKTDVSGGEDKELAPDRANFSSTVSAGSAAEHHSKVSVHRATAAARDVFEDNVLARVEKLRHVSSVVLDEAGYDPSLRFVLVAVVLFVLFLVLLFLSKWLG
jgi:hypothetical protein